MKELSLLFKPTKPIPTEATAVNGLTNEMLKNKKYFKEHYKEINDFFQNALICGFNHTTFDMLFLRKNMADCGNFEFLKDVKLFDVFSVFKKHNRHNLGSAVNFYLKESLEDAHNAKADVEATLKVMASQLEKENASPEEIYQKLEIGKDKDENKFLIEKEGQLYINFTKHKGEKIEDLEDSFISWIKRQDFVPQKVKDTINEYLRKVGTSRKPA